MTGTMLLTIAFLLSHAVDETASRRWMECTLRIHVPRYPRLARLARLTGTAIATIQPFEAPGGPKIEVTGVSSILLQAVETSLRESEFAPRCKADSISIRYTFRIEGEPDLRQDPTSISFKPPNEFVIVTPPSVPMPTTAR